MACIQHDRVAAQGSAFAVFQRNRQGTIRIIFHGIAIEGASALEMQAQGRFQILLINNPFRLAERIATRQIHAAAGRRGIVENEIHALCSETVNRIGPVIRAVDVFLRRKSHIDRHLPLGIECDIGIAFCGRGFHLHGIAWHRITFFYLLNILPVNAAAGFQLVIKVAVIARLLNDIIKSPFQNWHIGWAAGIIGGVTRQRFRIV